jgi:hypothetical protein
MWRKGKMYWKFLPYHVEKRFICSFYLFLKWYHWPSVAVHACKPSTKEAGVETQPETHNERLGSKKTKTKPGEELYLSSHSRWTELSHYNTQSIHFKDQLYFQKKNHSSFHGFIEKPEIANSHVSKPVHNSHEKSINWSLRNYLFFSISNTLVQGCWKTVWTRMEVWLPNSKWSELKRWWHKLFLF